jgi:hypothetical protein
MTNNDEIAAENFRKGWEAGRIAGLELAESECLHLASESVATMATHRECAEAIRFIIASFTDGRPVPVAPATPEPRPDEPERVAGRCSYCGELSARNRAVRESSGMIRLYCEAMCAQLSVEARRTK